MLKPLKYYQRLFLTAFRHSRSVADLASFLIGTLGLVLAHLIGSNVWEVALSTLAVQIAASVFGAIFIVRLLAAPYWMQLEDAAVAELAANKLRADGEATAKKLEEALAAQAAADRKDVIVTCLSNCLGKAQTLKHRLPKTAEESAAWNIEVNSWYGEAQVEILKTCGRPFLVRFTTAKVMAGFFSGCHQDSQNVLCHFDATMHNLAQMIDIQMAA